MLLGGGTHRRAGMARVAAAGVTFCLLKVLEEGLHVFGWKSVPKDTGPNGGDLLQAPGSH